ncbi:UDP-glucose 4-epimerase GalE [Desulfobotulus sp. H1]|uniref:UDP-glucose 4-epimerase n=1 Tax=Desulfobotulus pelophilus TaxID=2823377 RepID=A0ABT3NC80_9BACT|nr:UDP-glucose 4-epimerase GalE [Desulfobotulus pelophilus]MCW7755080.1 UDP-glucose 4-epimerase GalE [Desulfobotulus pelophilus]
MTILITGGAGYIGTHTCVELLLAGIHVVVVDNLANASREALSRVESITGKDVDFVYGDVRDKKMLQQVFRDHAVQSVIHFAGHKAVGESTERPLMYYDNNVGGTLSLLEVMMAEGVKNMVFSSSATVYGDPRTVPIREDFPLMPYNPYGKTKRVVEMVLEDVHAADPTWNIALLRYFNPVGAHESGLIGEDPRGIPNNLTPYITQVAVGKLEKLAVFGNDYPTPDGTGVRDYIHVKDLAKGHVKAIEKLQGKPGFFACNLGTGQGYSVLEVLAAFEKACQRPIPYEVKARRPGDIAMCYADTTFARDFLDWEAGFGIEEMAAHAWNWQKQNPGGYGAQ